jgi:hypothetical protein
MHYLYTRFDSTTGGIVGDCCSNQLEGLVGIVIHPGVSDHRFAFPALLKRKTLPITCFGSAYMIGVWY